MNNYIIRSRKQNSLFSKEITADDLPEISHPTLRDKILGFIILFIIFTVFFCLLIFILRKFLIFAANPKEFQSFIKKHGALGRTAFLGIQILQGFLPIPLEITAVAGGCVFGSVQGCIITICSVIISTTIIFYSTRIFGVKLYRLFFNPAKQTGLKLIRRPKLRSALYWIVFLIPGIPKRIFVYTAGLVPQRFSKFLFISTAARIPSFLACSFGGFALSNGSYGAAAAVLGVIFVFSVGGILLYRYISNKSGR